MAIKAYVRKVQYYETDMMGITHHANYIHWMEEARIDFMDQLGFPYTRMEAEGVLSPVKALSCEYKSPCTFGEEISIAVSVESFNGLVLTIVYDMQNQLGAWNTLPFIFPLELNVYDQHGIFDHTEIIPENIRFEWEKGMVTFIIQDLNGIDPANIANPYTFKVCVTK